MKPAPSYGRSGDPCNGPPLRNPSARECGCAPSLRVRASHTDPAPYDALSGDLRAPTARRAYTLAGKRAGAHRGSQSLDPGRRALESVCVGVMRVICVIQSVWLCDPPHSVPASSRRCRRSSADLPGLPAAPAAHTTSPPHHRHPHSHLDVLTTTLASWACEKHPVCHITWCQVWFRGPRRDTRSYVCDVPGGFLGRGESSWQHVATSCSP